MRTKVLNHFHTFHPDAQEEFNRLAAEEKRLTRAMAREPEPTGGPTPVRLDGRPRRLSQPPVNPEAELADVRAKMDEQRAIISSGVVRIIIKGLTRGEFRRLLTAHPPRENDPLDARVGYNADTFGDALIKACILRTEDLNGNPVPNDWDQWADEMTNGQWEDVFTACMKLTNDPEPVFPR